MCVFSAVLLGRADDPPAASARRACIHSQRRDFAAHGGSILARSHRARRNCVSLDHSLRPSPRHHQGALWAGCMDMHQRCAQRRRSGREACEPAWTTCCSFRARLGRLSKVFPCAARRHFASLETVLGGTMVGRGRLCVAAPGLFYRETRRSVLRSTRPRRQNRNKLVHLH